MRDPSTPAAVIAEIAHQYPESRAEVRSHPSAYPELIAWIDAQAPTASPQSVPTRSSRLPLLIIAGSAVVALVVGGVFALISSIPLTSEQRERAMYEAIDRIAEKHGTDLDFADTSCEYGFNDESNWTLEVVSVDSFRTDSDLASEGAPFGFLVTLRITKTHDLASEALVGESMSDKVDRELLQVDEIFDYSFTTEFVADNATDGEFIQPELPEARGMSYYAVSVVDPYGMDVGDSEEVVFGYAPKLREPAEFYGLLMGNCAFTGRVGG